MQVTVQQDITVIAGLESPICSVQDALDLLMDVSYHYSCNKLVLSADSFCSEFYDLKTTLLGQIFQKFVNYHSKLAIIGDFSGVESHSFRDFIYESNNGTNFFFVPTLQDALERLQQV